MDPKTLSLDPAANGRPLNLRRFATSKNIWDEVKENREKLAKCAGPHEFEPLGDDKQFSRKMQCRLCLGVVIRSDAEWYLRGLEHGRRE